MQPLLSDNGVAAIVEQDLDEIKQLVPYERLNLTAVTVEPDSNVTKSNSLSPFTQSQRVDFEAASGSLEGEAVRGAEMDTLIAASLQAAIVANPAPLSFVGSADYNVELAVVAGGSAAPFGAPTVTRITATTMEFSVLYDGAGVGRPFRMYDWAADDNGSTTPKHVILLRAYEDPDALGAAVTGSVLELLTSSTGGVTSGFSPGDIGAAMVATTGESPVLDFGVYRPFEEEGAGKSRNWSLLVKNTDGDGAGEYAAVEKVALGNLTIDAQADSNVMYTFDYDAKRGTAHLDASPANPAGDEFITPFVVSDQAVVNADTVAVVLHTARAGVPIVFSCDKAVATGFSASVESNNQRSAGTMCTTPSGTARGQKTPTLTLGTRLHSKDDEDAYGRITLLGDTEQPGGAEDVACQYIIAWPSKVVASTRRHEVCWLFMRNTVPKIFFDFSGLGSFLEEDVVMNGSRFTNYVGEDATFSYTKWVEG